MLLAFSFLSTPTLLFDLSIFLVPVIPCYNLCSINANIYCQDASSSSFLSFLLFTNSPSQLTVVSLPLSVSLYPSLLFPPTHCSLSIFPFSCYSLVLRFLLFSLSPLLLFSLSLSLYPINLLTSQKPIYVNQHSHTMPNPRSAIVNTMHVSKVWAN